MEIGSGPVVDRKSYASEIRFFARHCSGGRSSNPDSIVHACGCLSSAEHCPFGGGLRLGHIQDEAWLAVGEIEVPVSKTASPEMVGSTFSIQPNRLRRSQWRRWWRDLRLYMINDIMSKTA